MIVLSWVAVVIGFIVGAMTLGHVTATIAGVVVEREIHASDLVKFVVLAGVTALTSWGFLRVFEGRWHWLTGAITVWLILVVLFHLTMIVVVIDSSDNDFFTDVAHFAIHAIVAAVMAMSAATGTVYLDEMYRSAEDNDVVEDNGVRPHPLMVE